MKLKDYIRLTESNNERTMLSNMKKYKMSITSFGTGLGIEFVDEDGKEHYEESSGKGSNTDSLSIEAMVNFAMDEIAYRRDQRSKK